MIADCRDFRLSPSSGLSMLTLMLRPIAIASLLIVSWFIVSCGSSGEIPILVNESRVASIEGETIYLDARRADTAGKTKKAIKLYDEVADDFPFAPSAAKARYRQAQLLDQQGEVEDAFETYDAFLGRFPGSSLYTKAFNRLESIAFDVASGKVKGSFLGMERDIPLSTKVEMLSKIAVHAPKSERAAKAQFAIGQAYLAEEKYDKSVAAFRELVSDQPNSSLAPRALFKVGEILLQNAERGNQNQANLRLSREAFNDYLIQYPGHSRNNEARKKITELKARELKRSYEIAKFYEKTGEIKSARFYYSNIVSETKSGKLHDAAKARLKAIGN